MTSIDQTRNIFDVVSLWMGLWLSVPLEWNAPEPCPDQQAVVHALESRIGRTLGEDEGITISAAVSQGEAADLTFRLELSLESRSGKATEVHTASQCETLAELVALKAALAIDPLAVLRAEQAASAVAPKAAPSPPHEGAAEPGATSSELVATAQPEPSTSSSPRFGGLVRAEALIGSGIYPKFGGAAALSVGLLGPYFEVSVRSAYFIPRTARFRDLPSVGATISALELGLQACGRPERGNFSVPICLTGAGAVVWAQGVGAADQTTREAQALAQLGVLVAMRWKPSRLLALWLGVEGVVALRRPGYEIDGLGSVYRAGSVGVRGILGIEVHFPGSAP